ncbi:MAG TPA: hypothetical protein VKA83_24825 [Methylomirabilota bacterium]|jgi:hypothetical protein|nr:hypothetical protein [Methylomirabilota bacterium]
MRHTLAIAAGLSLMTASPVAADGVRVGVGVSVPLPAPPTVVITPPRPPVVVVAPPQLVVVPGSPVFYAPNASMNFFAYGGRYYSFHEGAWFVAPTYGSPWVAIAPAKVPRPVLAVPVTYYKVPPGHAKKMGHHCPPGLAKQGRC